MAHGMVKAAGLPDTGGDGSIEMIGTTQAPFFDQDGVHEIYREWRPIIEEYEGDRIFVAEAWTDSAERRALYLRPDELHQAFNFDLVLAPSQPPTSARRSTPRSRTTPAWAPCTWVLSNHDVQRHVTRYGDGETGLARAKGATQLLMALPGVVYVYQGEELGLNEVLDLPDEVRRTRPSTARTASRSAATAAASRCRGSRTARAWASARAAPGSRNRRTGRPSPSRPKKGKRARPWSSTGRRSPSGRSTRRRS
ncbi:hypothetical protein GCM10029992_17240 [Glycomyces albus]